MLSHYRRIKNHRRVGVEVRAHPFDRHGTGLDFGEAQGAVAGRTRSPGGRAAETADMKKPISAYEYHRLENQAYALIGKLYFVVANEGNSRGRLRRLMAALARATARAERRYQPWVKS
jgi:hypothetical protein